MGKIHCKYYTPIEKMEAVKPLMNIDNCKSVIDLSAGCGDMIIPLLDILSEDIDVTAVDICWEQNNKNDLEKKYSIKCIEEDSMKWFINNEKKYDLVLSNPPFNASKITKFSDELLGCLELENTKNYYIEEIFTLMNIRLLNEEGRFLFILPATILSNLSGKWIREILISELEIKYILEMSCKAFEDAHVNTHMVVGKKKKSGHIKNNIKLGKVNDFDEIDIMGEVNQIFVKDRLDTSYLLSDEVSVKSNSLPLNLVIKKDSLSRGYMKYPKYEIYSTEKKRGGMPIWHTTNLRNGCLKEDKKQLYTKVGEYGFNNNAVVYAGDILIGRVGSGSVGNTSYVTKNDSGMASDCLYVVRMSNEIESFILFLFLNTRPIKDKLKNISRGINHSSLTVTDLKELSVPNNVVLKNIANELNLNRISRNTIKKYLKYADKVFDKYFLKVDEYREKEDVALEELLRNNLG